MIEAVTLVVLFGTIGFLFERLITAIRKEYGRKK